MAADRNRFDALIVGAGVIGLAIAWRAAQRGLRVRVLERERPGAGASSVAAGMVTPVSEATWGEEELLRLALRSHEAWARFARELAAAAGREVGYLELGALHVAFDRDEAEALRHRFELMGSLDLEAEWLRPREARRLEPGLAPSCSAAVLAPQESAIDPRELVAALGLAAEREGVEVRSGAEVVEAIVDGDAIAGVRTGDGVEHRAGRVVLAAGAWSGVASWLPEAARPPVRPVKGQILTLRGSPGAPVCERIVVPERIYMVPRGDGRLVIGATVEEMGFDTTITAGGVHELLREAYRALPDVAELELAETIAGVRPGSPDNAPLIGPGSIDGLVYATGHFRSGILLAPVTADAVAAWLGGSEPEVDVTAFSPVRFAEAAV